MSSPVLELLNRLLQASVLCVGDSMIDRYIYGQATRISPEAPVPVVRVDRRLVAPGGVGNVARNLAELGCCPYLVSLAGEDHEARELAGLLTLAGCPPPVLVADPGRPTSLKTRIIAGIQQVVRYDEEVITPLTGPVAEKFLAEVQALLPRVSAVALSDYGKGVLAEDVAREIIRLARAAGRPVVVDPKGADYSKYRGATLITPNRAEFSEAVGRKADTPGEMATYGWKLMAEQDIANLLITRSEEGMLLLSANRESVLLPSQAREVFDVSGAGDTVVAVMAASLALAAPLDLGARLATLAAGVVVGKVGTAPASPVEIRAAARMASPNGLTD